MGELYSRPERMPSQIKFNYSEKEIFLPSYKSYEDIYYEMQDKKYNFLRKLNFQDFLYSLVNFENENITLDDDYSKSNINYSMNQPFYNENLSEDMFQAFIENKILKYKNIFIEAINKNYKTAIFKEYLMALYNSLNIKLTQNKRIKGIKITNRDSIIKKCDVIPFGLLYCCGPNYIRVKTIFNIFSENGQLKQSEKFNEFLLSLFLIACFCNARARFKLSRYDEIGPIEKQKLVELLDSSDFQNCIKLIKKVNKLIFGKDNSAILNYEKFKKKFTQNENSIGFILFPSGIRNMLHKYAEQN